jgi:hypothetical protein
VVYLLARRVDLSAACHHRIPVTAIHIGSGRRHAGGVMRWRRPGGVRICVARTRRHHHHHPKRRVNSALHHLPRRSFPLPHVPPASTNSDSTKTSWIRESTTRPRRSRPRPSTPRSFWTRSPAAPTHGHERNRTPPSSTNFADDDALLAVRRGATPVLSPASTASRARSPASESRPLRSPVTACTKPSF